MLVRGADRVGDVGGVGQSRSLQGGVGGLRGVEIGEASVSRTLDFRAGLLPREWPEKEAYDPSLGIYI